ncbi:unnamed protein product [Mytilus coruscus]|uniref:t-SNARE coiled-coil homology domain-containing protein n=1 Tax=Mytilus coruscus TaxID=42192 RepID=A0A6J8E6W5_MYTCO|nr:unnamed protein product [Mytilus coruscus]
MAKMYIAFIISLYFSLFVEVVARCIPLTKPVDFSTAKAGLVIEWEVFRDYTNKFSLNPTVSIEVIEEIVVEIQSYKIFLEYLIDLEDLADLWNWMYCCKVKVVLYTLVLFSIYSITKEKFIYSRLRREMKVLQGLMHHDQWRIEESEEEMHALILRLNKNKEYRLPELILSLQAIYSKMDTNRQSEHKFTSELTTWKHTIMTNTSKLRSLNKEIREQPVEDTVRRIMDTGRYAASTIMDTVEDLHYQIEAARDALNNSSKLMDIKGNNVKCDRKRGM